MKVAVIGRRGQVAQCLRERASARKMDLAFLGRPEFDLTRTDEVEASLSSLDAHAVINVAAYTNVERAETEGAIAYQVNSVGAGAVACAAHRLGLPIVHYSTDYVFDGRLDRPYRETDPAKPVNRYGETKLSGEREVAKATMDYAIVRTGWVHSPFGNNFVRTMLRVARTHGAAKVVDDQVGVPNNALDLADATLRIVEKLVDDPSAAYRGTFNLSADRSITWREFAEEIFEASRAIGGPTATVLGIPSCAYPSVALRPSNSRLDATKLFETYGIRLPPWRSLLGETVGRLLPSTEGP
jgi:dTDP-4-dehydrorhamnose reductase